MRTADFTEVKASEAESWENTHREDFFAEYQRLAARTDQNPRDGVPGLAFPLLGFFGEVGTLLSALKKKQRDKDSYIGYSEILLEEFGDVLWYFCNISTRLSLDIRDIVRDASATGEIRFDRQFERGAADFEKAVIALGGKAGALLHQFTHECRSTDLARFWPNLVEIFAALMRAAALVNIDLEEAARSNLLKINSRWPETQQYAPLFDAEYPDSEKLPRRLEMHIVETDIAGKRYAVQLCNDVEIGSRLTDNKLMQDDYRFHDVFHLTYAAILGWSPCLRSLLRVKRKSNPEVDEAEDGARAALIEEGVSTLVFQHAVRLNYFESVKSLDYPLLKSVRDFVTGYEVDQCPLWQWEKAILDGFAVFRQIREHRQGVVVADLTNRSITFEARPNDG